MEKLIYLPSSTKNSSIKNNIFLEEKIGIFKNKIQNIFTWWVEVKNWTFRDKSWKDEILPGTFFADSEYL